MTIKKSLLEHEIESGIAQLTLLKDSGMNQTELSGFYHKELELHNKYVDYILTVYHLTDHKIIEYRNQLKDLLK